MIDKIIITVVVSLVISTNVSLSALVNLDTPENLILLRLWRQSVYKKLRSTIANDQNNLLLQQNNKLQPLINSSTPFLCPLNGTISSTRPESVHKLRPGDINVVGALGDSLSAGVGLTATNLLQVYYENREISASTGGAANWRRYLTIPNILKEFNPNLIGYVKEASVTIHKESQFNVAETGAMSEDMPYMAGILVKRIKSDSRIDILKDWKYITILVGPNDFCSGICYKNNFDKVLASHKSDLIKTLKILKDNLPKTLVNLIIVPNLKVLINFTNKSLSCIFNHLFACPCLFGTTFSKQRNKFVELMSKWQQIELDVCNLEEFDTNDFTVVGQTFAVNFTYPVTEEGTTDYTYVSEDCFHFSQKGNAIIANSLWNNMLEPVGKKSQNIPSVFQKFNCPTADNPYIFTRRNS